MAQRQKHWVQSMLNEDTYVPFPYFYDVTAWSRPLLYDVAGGRSGAPLAAATTVVLPVGDPADPAPPADPPKIAVFSMSPMSYAASSRPAGCAGCSTSGSCRTPT